jgi:hypothetical protein
VIGIATALLALSVGDLIAGGLTGEPQRLRRLLLGTVGAGVASWIVLHQSGLAPRTATSVFVGVVLATCSWLLCKLGLARAEQRQEGTLARRWATFALLVSGLSVVVPLVLAAPLHSDLPRLSAWTRALPFPRARAVTGAEFLLLLAILLFRRGDGVLLAWIPRELGPRPGVRPPTGLAGEHTSTAQGASASDAPGSLHEQGALEDLAPGRSY